MARTRSNLFTQSAASRFSEWILFTRLRPDQTRAVNEGTMPKGRNTARVRSNRRRPAGSLIVGKMGCVANQVSIRLSSCCIFSGRHTRITPILNVFLTTAHRFHYILMPKSNFMIATFF